MDPPDQEPTATLVPRPGRHALPDLRSRFSWTPAHLGVVAVLVAAALCLLAWSVLHRAPQEISAPVPGPAANGAPLLVSATPTTSADRSVVIDVAGKVRRPGVATLPGGSRVIDALRRAGGARRGVDLSTLNLARPLVDGEQILVGVSGATGRSANAAGPAPADGTLVNLNAASAEQLEGLPGVGPVTAAKIVEWRTGHGAFTAVDELLDVDGIGTKTLAELAPHVTL